MENRKRHFTRANQVVVDLLIFVLALFFAYFIRFEGLPSARYLRQLVFVFFWIVLARLLSFSLLSVYSIVWRYISVDDAFLILEACMPVTFILSIARLALPDKLAALRLPISVIALEFLLTLTGTLAARMGRRVFYETSERERFEKSRTEGNRIRAVLVGAGDAGNMVARELKQRTDLGIDLVGFIDDDYRKRRTMIQGIRVLGTTGQIPEIIKRMRIERVIISIANASSKDIKRIVAICEGARVKVRIIPALSELLDGQIKISKIRDVNIEDLLGRSVVSFRNHRPQIADLYRDKKILITGAGGSIGSELCRQVSGLAPRELCLLDKDENGIYEIVSELNSRHLGFGITPLIADIRDFGRLRLGFERCHPDVIFHAAAHKHVPLMEVNAAEAILNNVQGTLNVCMLADEFGAERFVFISTDKAVNPTSVMGASKKMGEMIIQERAAKSGTKYSCVRFGNVLGSRGSVVPLFQKQIAAGGPVTVTHPEISRYFMSISEAVQLIIQAGTLGEKGEIFVLDMGEPIKIIDLARDLIRLSGLAEDEIEIKCVGVRPGEKLYEEILIDEEKAKATRFDKVFKAAPIEIDEESFSQKLGELIQAARSGDDTRVVACLQELGISYVATR